jgi:hypothetical protein
VGGTVICLDEHGSIAAMADVAPRRSDAAHRPGEVRMETADRRDTCSWPHFLDSPAMFAPAGEVSLIADALPVHWTLDTLRWHWGHLRFHCVPVPTAAAWRNLIAGCWTILDQRALAGRTCRSVADGHRHPTPFRRGDQLKRACGYRV